MLLTCRSIVFSLNESLLAMALLVSPVATRRRTCCSRGVRPCALTGRDGRYQGIDPSEVRCGAQPLEYGPGRVNFQIGTILVPEGAAGQSDQHPHARCRVGHLDPLPHLEGAAQQAECGLRVAFGQLDRPARLRGNRAGHPRIEAPSNLSQLPAGIARVLDVASGQHDLDMGRQQAHTLQSVRRGANRAANSGHGRRRAPLREAQQGKARLGLQAQLTGASVRRLGRSERPCEALDLSLLVKRCGGSVLVDTLRPRAGALRLFDRL